MSALPPRDILDRSEVRAAIAVHDLGTVFRIARSEAGISYSKIAAESDIKPERVGSLARGEVSVTTFGKIVQIADALRIPGPMLGLTRREWEEARSTPPSTALRTVTLPSHEPAADDLWVVSPGDDLTDPEFTAALIESQLPQHYKSANYFGARQPLATVVHHAKTIGRLLQNANGSTRHELMRIGSRTADPPGHGHDRLRVRIARADSSSALTWFSAGHGGAPSRARRRVDHAARRGSAGACWGSLCAGPGPCWGSRC